MSNKIFTAFVSSVFSNLRSERYEVIDSLLDFRILPISMEHFTVSTNGNFSDIMELIDDADFFVIVMGADYGSVDEDGVSWTEREYIYADKKGKQIVAIVSEDLAKLRCQDPDTLTESQRKQVEFSSRVPFARTATAEFPVKTIVTQFFSNYNFEKCTGWSRVYDDISGAELEEWRAANRIFDIGGSWHHVHLSDEDDSYIRIGTVQIRQNFAPGKYGELTMDGQNYSVLYCDQTTGALKENRMKSSRFVGEYTMRDNGEIFGIFNAVRMFQGDFASISVQKGTHRGIHDLVLDLSRPLESATDFIEGEFHDEAPSPKMGRLFLFRDVKERDAFVMENRAEYVQVK